MLVIVLEAIKVLLCIDALLIWFMPSLIMRFFPGTIWGYRASLLKARRAKLITMIGLLVLIIQIQLMIL